MSAKILDPIVWEYIGEIIKDFSLVEEAIQILKKKKDPNQANLTSVANSIEKAKAQQDILVEDLSRKDEKGLPKLRGRARDLVLDDLSKWETYLEELEEEKRSIEEGKVQWEQIQEDIDKFVAWCLTARETYPNATYEEKRRAIRFLGIVVYVYREKDPENPFPDQRHYDIKAGFPDIVFPPHLAGLLIQSL